jgi:hypothetical protein
MNQQLDLFGTVATTAVVVAKPAPAAKASRKPTYYIEKDGDYHCVWLEETHLGYIYHIGGGTWGLYFPGERGVCGFGGPGQQGAAAELHQCSIRKAKGLEV